MLKKIARKAFLERYPDFIQANYRKDEYNEPVFFNSYLLSVDAASTIGRNNRISKEVTKLFQKLSYEKLSFLGDTTIPWLFRDHDYLPVKNALTYLANKNISKTFNGTIEVAVAELPEFLKNLFWLVRCNGIVFYANFSDPGFNIIASICKYGNLHLSTLNESADIAFREAVLLTKLQMIEAVLW
jgi:hypothetical protein